MSPLLSLKGPITLSNSALERCLVAGVTIITAPGFSVVAGCLGFLFLVVYYVWLVNIILGCYGEEEKKNNFYFRKENNHKQKVHWHEVFVT